MTLRILIVEDDIILAVDLAEQLTAMGYDVIGPCKSTDQALSVLKTETCDVAVLDINLGGETSEKVAMKLKADRIPFVIASGYNSDQWPSVFEGSAAVNKPYQATSLVELIQQSA